MAYLIWRDNHGTREQPPALELECKCAAVQLSLFFEVARARRGILPQHRPAADICMEARASGNHGGGEPQRGNVPAGGDWRHKSDSMRFMRLNATFRTTLYPRRLCDQQLHLPDFPNLQRDDLVGKLSHPDR